ncbi:hypothetical protein GJ496_005799 [Pomphorhynchus laevis]|nr:hypothetical protein GJ496_005799 [Pomphorhynchus laevis]
MHHILSFPINKSMLTLKTKLQDRMQGMKQVVWMMCLISYGLLAVSENAANSDESLTIPGDDSSETKRWKPKCEEESGEFESIHENINFRRYRFRDSNGKNRHPVGKRRMANRGRKYHHHLRLFNEIKKTTVDQKPVVIIELEKLIGPGLLFQAPKVVNSSEYAENATNVEREIPISTSESGLVGNYDNSDGINKMVSTDLKNALGLTNQDNAQMRTLVINNTLQVINDINSGNKTGRMALTELENTPTLTHNYPELNSTGMDGIAFIEQIQNAPGLIYNDNERYNTEEIKQSGLTVNNQSASNLDSNAKDKLSNLINLINDHNSSILVKELQKLCTLTRYNNSRFSLVCDVDDN